jgi:hypothetical protein
MKAAKPAETMPKMKDAGKLIGQRTTPTNKTTSSQVVNLKAAKPSSAQTTNSSATKSSTPANKGFAPTRGLVSARGGFSLGGYVGKITGGDDGPSLPTPGPLPTPPPTPGLDRLPPGLKPVVDPVGTIAGKIGVSSGSSTVKLSGGGSVKVGEVSSVVSAPSASNTLGGLGKRLPGTSSTTFSPGDVIRQPAPSVPTTKELADRVVKGGKAGGGKIINGGKRILDNAERQVNNSPRDFERTRAIASRDWSRELGRPWMYGVKYPWDSWFNRQITTIEDRGSRIDNKNRENVNNAASWEPDFFPADNEDVDYAGVRNAGGKAEVLYSGTLARHASIDAASGGSIKVKVRDCAEGKPLTVTTDALIQEGRARIVLRRDDGKIIGAGQWLTKDDINKEVPRFSETFDVPCDGLGYGNSDSHGYYAELEFEAGSKALFFETTLRRPRSSD